MERCTIIVDVRDRFSTTPTCLETLLSNTPGAHDYLAVMGGVPPQLRARWTQQFGNRVRFMFVESFLNQAQARNIALREAKTRLAVQMDNDNYVRPGWLEALVRRQQETGAVMVVPTILETPRKIHTAGNDLYISYERGKAYGYKHLRYHGMILGEHSNLKRCRTDYSELHCQLVEVEPTLRLGANDERIVEVGEVDQGLTFAKAGREMWFEPSAVVHFALGCPIEAEDIRCFAWRWNIRHVHDGYQYFQQKWNMDISEYGTFRDWLVRYNNQLGLLPRHFPSATALRIDRWVGQTRTRLLEFCRIPKYRLRQYKKRLLGYHEWTAGISTD